MHASAGESAYPSRPVRIIVPYAPGGATDTLGRILAADLGAAFDQSYYVENRPGASGTIGLEVAAQTPADGYTLVVINTTHLSWAALGGKSSVDLVRDFIPVALLGTSPVLIAATPRGGIATLDEFIERARALPGTLSYASCGVGTAGHLVGELLKAVARIQVLHVPYRGCAPAVQGALGGQVDLVITSVTSGLPHVGPGRLRGLAVTSPDRLAAAPNLPTVRELGFAELSIQVWHGLVAPANTPNDLIQRLQGEVLRALRNGVNRTRLAQVGIDPPFGTGAEFGALIRSESAKYLDVVQRARLGPQ
jgi:tripartite-type tricarboxylate transporter receptor subunit TctC